MFFRATSQRSTAPSQNLPGSQLVQPRAPRLKFANGNAAVGLDCNMFFVLTYTMLCKLSTAALAAAPF